jgi:hypothetical protein
MKVSAVGVGSVTLVASGDEEAHPSYAVMTGITVSTPAAPPPDLWAVDQEFMVTFDAVT